jgi:hypothetical protein
MALGLFFYGGWHVFLYEIPKIREKVRARTLAQPLGVYQSLCRLLDRV